MNKTFQSLALACVCLLFSFGAVAQQIQENNLVPPTQMNNASGSLLGSGISDAGNIYYGATPSNLRAGSPVIVFIHGYFSRASSWWILNDMYNKAYNDGYRTAFVSVHPDKNMWTNGQLFSNMLNTITNKMGVNKVVVVAHSKGGLDTDAAVVHYGAHTKVERVITLSTPHYGTPLADLAQSGWVSWLSSVFGQVNEATYCLQTGYASYFRTQTSNHPNYSKAKFRTVGAWGYGLVFSVPGVYLDLNGGSAFTGGNDGVVTYKSSKRPDAMHLLGGFGNWRTNYNHLEVQQGYSMWSTIKSNLPYTLSKTSAGGVKYEKATNPNAVVESRVQVLSSEKTSRTFTVEEGVTETMLDLHFLNENEEFTITSPSGKQINPSILRRVGEQTDDLLGGYTTTFKIESPEAGMYSIESKDAFVALVTANEGIGLRMTSDLNDDKYYYNVGETINLNIDILNEKGINVAGAKVTGVMNLTSSDGKSKNAVVLEFKQQNGQFTASVNETLEEGIYSVAIQAENGNFSKSLITSIAVVDGVLHTLGKNDVNDMEKNEVESIKLLLSYPNPFNAQTTVKFELKSSASSVLTIYDAVGRSVETVDLSSYGIGTHEYVWNVKGNMNSGLYIAEIRNGNERVTQTMIYSK
ncbi:T9SS type A sorting domain-containing protein [Bernardetia sp.]|uniref:T9SS type A sorting domain-containing protein n=1 Tax=Bernardetia sp. TaxID=1937974 RepID=UPI0025BF7093|nr:T9SS type A sorting domain-containing protein [Bernardetia sp.]